MLGSQSTFHGTRTGGTPLSAFRVRGYGVGLRCSSWGGLAGTGSEILPVPLPSPSLSVSFAFN
eukprot:989830-Amphidinium_carterae.1